VLKKSTIGLRLGHVALVSLMGSATRISLALTPGDVGPPLPLLSSHDAMHGGDCGSKVWVTVPSGHV
jgi:hypothetical protein